jgi:hypothetical protein
MECSLQFIIPEFKECWWDSLLIDLLGNTHAHKTQTQRRRKAHPIHLSYSSEYRNTKE